MSEPSDDMPTTGRAGPPGPWGLRDAVQVFGIVVLAGPVVFGLISIGVLPGLDTTDSTPFWTGVTTVYYGMPMMAIVLLAHRRTEGFLLSLGLSGANPYWLLGGAFLGAFVTVSFNTAYTAIASLLGLGPPEASMRVMELLAADVGDGPVETIVGVSLVVLVAPMIEEVVFRGVVLSGLMRRMGPIGGIATTSVLFAAVHLDPWRFVPLMFLGGVLGYLAWQARSVWPAVLAHALVNAFAYVMALVVSAGG